MKMMKVKKVFLIVVLILFIISLVCIATTEASSFKARREIKEFIKRGALIYTSEDTRYYKVIKEREYEDTNNIISDYSNNYIGTTGDIYLTCTDWGASVLTKYLCRRLYVGHAGLVSRTDASKLYEVVGNRKASDNVVKEYDNDWYELKHFKEEIILRVKEMDDSKKDKLISYVDSIKGANYNPFFLAHIKDKYYCTDLITRAYSDSLDIDISKGGITTGAKMIENTNTYIIYYKREVNDGNIKYEVYFLGDE